MLVYGVFIQTILWADLSDLRMEVLLKLQLLFQGLYAVFSIHPPQHLILELLPGITQTGVQLRHKWIENYTEGSQVINRASSEDKNLNCSNPSLQEEEGRDKCELDA